MKNKIKKQVKEIITQPTFKTGFLIALTLFIFSIILCLIGSGRNIDGFHKEQYCIARGMPNTTCPWGVDDPHANPGEERCWKEGECLLMVDSLVNDDCFIDKHRDKLICKNKQIYKGG